jgi:hypothetical protein
MNGAKLLQDWIAKNFNPHTRVHINQYIPDFMVRRLFQSETGVAASQDEFVQAMLDNGFHGRQTKHHDWVFNISDAEYQKVLRRLR